MNVLSEIIHEALNHQGGYASVDGNGDVTRFIEVAPAGVRYLSLNDVMTPKSGSQFTLSGSLAINSLVVRAGAEVIRIQPVEQSPAGASITLKQLEGKFVTVESANFSAVPDGVEVTDSIAPYLVAAYDSTTAPCYGVAFNLTRKQLKHEFVDDTIMRAVNTAIELGISNLADFVLLNHLETEAQTMNDVTFKGLAKVAAARGLRWDELRALAGGECTGLEVDGTGILRAFGVRAELSKNTSKTIIGAFSRTAIGIDDEIRIIAKREKNGSVQVVVWVNAQALVPDNTAFWKA
ncbi:MULTISPECIES: hypothetical protein [Serratia]|uniref:Phage major capsid protein n=1 Tax=Serratia plymuthica TaxID=82996 RepID=A0A318PFH2_SERPL|nr:MULTISPECIES: hypothetical protein [Serratia]AGO57180.1 hypothetical protein SOD_c42310 [Serratia plymuthica 4Rx13]PYD38357.1 hypothetical protein CT690_15890 [Serratia plymuthica]RYM47819.1 hypothetical protein BSQ96_22410 [Serratia proteamaculans]